LPTDSREFFEPFRRTLEQNEAFVRECVRQGVREQLAALAKRARPCLEHLAPLLADPRMRHRVEEFDQREKEQGRRAAGKGQWSVLTWAADPTTKEVSERFLERYVADEHAPIAAEACFPLPGADPSSGAPQKFPWARPRESAGSNHQVLVLRLRDALADSMRRRVLQLVSQLSKQVLDGLQDTFTVWSERLLVLSGNAPLLACVAGESPAGAAGQEWKTPAVEYPLEPPEDRGTG
jgi:hypothetical protein